MKIFGIISFGVCIVFLSFVGGPAGEAGADVDGPIVAVEPEVIGLVVVEEGFGDGEWDAAGAGDLFDFVEGWDGGFGGFGWSWFPFPLHPLLFRYQGTRLYLYRSRCRGRRCNSVT